MKKSAFILGLCLVALQFTFAQFKITNDNKIGIGTSPDTNYGITMGNDVVFKGNYGNSVKISALAGSGGPFVDISPLGNYYSYLGMYNSWSTACIKSLYVYTNLNVYGTFYNASDKRLKKDINQLFFNKSAFTQLRPVSYDMLDSVSYTQKGGGKKTLIFEKKKNHINGFIAQEVQQIYPELVEEDSETGLLKIKSLEFIPILVTAIKDMQLQIDSLSELVKQSSSSSQKKIIAVTTTPTETDALTYPILDQNTPNPFNAATTIGFYLPKTVGTAGIYVYDMNGVQLKNHPVAERGKGTVTIQGSEFSAGMYLYALIADGKVIDTKRMILTK